MPPPEQRLDADYTLGAQVNDGLEKQAELVPIESDVQIGFQTDQAYGGTAHARCVCNAERILVPLGDRQSYIRLAQRVVRSLQARVDAGKSDVRGDPDAVLAQCERLLARVLKFVGDCVCGCSRGHLIHQHRQLVAPPAGQHALQPPKCLCEALCRLQHQFITGGVAQRIVDELEAVNVDENNRNALPASSSQLAQSTVKLIHEIAAIG